MRGDEPRTLGFLPLPWIERMGEKRLDEMDSPEIFEAAARALINERCAPAFLHDVRGSMQALFSALELLGRSAKMGGANPLRVEKACDLAQRAILRHEKSTFELLQLLTLQQAEPVAVDFGELLQEAAHLLRNDAATKGVTITTSLATDVFIRVEKAKLHSMLVGLFTAAIDAMEQGAELTIALQRTDDRASLTIAFDAARPLNRGGEAARQPPHAANLTLRFAHQFINSNAGCLEIDSDVGERRVLRLHLPSFNPGR
jgi:signal transduction histidine kinase